MNDYQNIQMTTAHVEPLHPERLLGFNRTGCDSE